ncbi:hypothetical protein BOTBODRAFT_33843 [Botryobasidium botryosum FD-172 SS1]|uniref:F-box domain-containing protein n=1 Tax=Botryobasidium botryosum (strain FD-172 SS1) TaxID=930990 RepID=A0A067MNS3_BOTB1|nr:hypothetical protein BOTBODRAFT_33843 [Botryobasidium botryosum FD-172 SS1]
MIARAYKYELIQIPRSVDSCSPRALMSTNADSADLQQLVRALFDDARGKFDPIHDVAAANADRAPLEREAAVVNLVTEAVNAYAALKLSYIRRRQNQLVPIHRLPFEILSSVFQFAERGIDTRESTSQFLSDISSVSHLWRQIVLDTPRLWTRLFLLPATIASTFLSRSKHAPLHVHYDSRLPQRLDLPSYLELVSPQLHRWKSCKLHGLSIEKHGSFLQAPAPNLEVLELTANPRLMPTDQLGGFDPFVGSTPRLHELTLDAIYIPFTNAIYTGLSKLSLSHINFANPDSLNQLIRVLGASPRIEVFQLQKLTFSFTIAEVAPSVSVSSAVQLPHLRFLKMVPHNDSHWAYRYILSHIITPPSLQFDLRTFLRSGDDLSEVLPPWSDSPNLPRLSQTQTLSFANRPETSYDDQALEIRSFESGDLVASCYLTGSDLVQGTLSSLGQLFPMPFLEHVTFTSICTDGEPGAVFAFANFLARHPTIKSISFTKCPEEFIEVLAHTPAQQLCPSLTKLSVTSCDIGVPSLTKIVESRAVSGGSGRSSPDGGATCLEHLDVHRCPRITRESVLLLDKYMAVGST